MSNEVKIGDQIGPFRIIGRLGSGGAGAVYKAENSETGELRALKTLTPGTVVNEEIHKRFVREITVAQKLRHPNVVAYDDCGLHEEILYYTMELVPWGSLADTLARRVRLGWRDAVECAMHISDGLAHLHEASIVHRDLKPENIFLSDEGRLKVGDFGLARDFNSTRLTLEGKTVGTLKYIAPEQAMAKSQIDGRTDIYALGCILFEMLAGGAPFVEDDPGSPAGYAQLMQKHIHEEPPAIAELVADCPASLSGLLSKMLAKSPGDRPQSAPAVKRMLANILAGKPVDFEGARKEKKSLAKTSAASTLTERLQNPDSQNRKSFPTALVITTIILLALAAIAIVSLF